MSTGTNSPAVFECCSHCGRRFEQDVRYPVTVEEDDDGTLSIHSFCDDDCQDAWNAER